MGNAINVVITGSLESTIIAPQLCIEIVDELEYDMTIGDSCDD